LPPALNPQPVGLEDYLSGPQPVDPCLRWLLGSARAPVILDIGACEGEDSIRYGRLFADARIFSFEPLPANQEIIRANFARYGSAAELVPVALADRAGPATFHVSAGRPAELFSGPEWNYGNKSSSLLPPKAAEKMHGWIDFPSTITVSTETLDAFRAARGLDWIDFVHLDVQGAEGLVLAGGEATLPRVGAVWLEVTTRELYRGQPLAAQIDATMRRQGFALAFAVQHEIEGDRLYLNLRRGRNLLWLCAQRLRRLLAAGARALRLRPPLPPS
jgi:FkbM family methyltransferase